jgi:import receptor subunit TOM22
MVKLEEVMDEEFVREQEGPHDDDDWDTDSGTQHLSNATPYQQAIPC